MKSKKQNNGANLGFEQKLWLAADKLRLNMDAGVYKHVVLGLIFLKYISDSFEEKFLELSKDKNSDPEDRDEYTSANIFWVAKKARWQELQANAKQVEIGKIIDDAMIAIEKDNPSIKGILPKDYARATLDKKRLGELIDLIGTIELGDKENRSKDILGRVYEYFLGKFAAAEGKGAGQFYTPRSIVNLLVEMIEPYKGRIFDPCCGSGGMFVQSEKFVETHGGNIGDVMIYGQESNDTTWRLCKMNLAIRGIDSDIQWHTQGSGKSLTMTIYSAKLIKHKAMKNPTIIVITDRNDLDDQLFDAFSKDEDLLRQTPVQANSRDDLKEKLNIASGGVIFSTIQKFSPPKDTKSDKISDRRNIIIIADEAHRSQYDLIDGYAGYIRDALPNASFIGFTGTPIETGDKNTRVIFGDYLSVYDIQQAVHDNFTVKIFYEGRLAKLALDESEKINIDEEFQEITEDQEENTRQKVKSKWARVEAIVGSERRIKEVAQDIVNHFEKRLEAMEGKGMIVCMSRRICVDLYEQITKIRPNWHDENDKKGEIKVIMTGSASDPLRYQQHVRDKNRREEIKKRLKDPKDPLKLVIVRDMWLTGFDAPVLHTMYVDKPMQGHSLMQAIARVNRVFGDKQGGLIVDYIGIAYYLKKALSYYSQADREQAGIPIEVALNLLLEKYDIVKSLLYKFDYSKYFLGDPKEKLRVVAGAMAHISDQKDGSKRFVSGVNALVKAFSLAGAHDDAMKIKHEVAFFVNLKANFVKHTVTEEEEKEGGEGVDLAMSQLVSKATLPVGVIDLLDAYGVKSPDISILSDKFLEEIQNMKHKNMAIELLNRLLKNEIKTRSKKNLIQSRTFTEMLREAIRKYEHRTVEAAQILSELIKLAEEIREAYRRGEKLKLTDDEIAFYDALEVNDSAVKILGDDTLQQIARELVESIHQNVTIDWTKRENVRAKLRLTVKKILRKYGYPPDKQEKATQTVLEQAELIAKDWSELN